MGQIGRYLDSLTPVQEDRVLTEAFERYGKVGLHHDTIQARCLVDVACARLPGGTTQLLRRSTDNGLTIDYVPNVNVSDRELLVGLAYDDTSKRFGEMQVNAMIRTRVLNNQAKRALRAIRGEHGRPTQTVAARA